MTKRKEKRPHLRLDGGRTGVLSAVKSKGKREKKGVKYAPPEYGKKETISFGALKRT